MIDLLEGIRMMFYCLRSYHIQCIALGSDRESWTCDSCILPNLFMNEDRDD